MPIIGISGKIGSGKSTTCRILREQLGFEKWQVKSFADKLREAVALCTGFTPDEMKRHDVKNTVVPHLGITVGTLLQRVGAKVREGDPDGWIVLLFAEYHPTESFWIIEDVRFQNEATTIKRYPDSILIRLEGDPAGERARSTRDPLHPSETDLDHFTFDAQFDNQKSMEELESSLRAYFATINRGPVDAPI